MGARDEPAAEVVDGHEGGVDDADVDAADGEDTPVDDSAGLLDGNAIIAPAALQIG